MGYLPQEMKIENYVVWSFKIKNTLLFPIAGVRTIVKKCKNKLLYKRRGSYKTGLIFKRMKFENKFNFQS